MGNMYCTIAISSLISNHGYAIGDLVKAKAYATNARGSGSESSPNTTGDIIALVPQTAPTPVASSISATTLALSWSALSLDSETGGLAITSYNLEYDQGTSNWAEVQGETSDSLATTASLSSLTPG